MRNFILYKLMLMVLVALSFSSNAAIQGTSFTYQGEILENGVPLNDVRYFIIEFYDSLTGGLKIESSAEIETTITNGIFTLEIDIGDMPFNGNSVWAEIVLDPVTRGGHGNVVFSPRQLITNVPYAIQSQFVGTDGVSTLSIKNASVITSKLADNAVTTTKLANASVTAIKLANNTVGNNQLAINSVNSSNIINGSIINIDIAANAITEVQLASNSVGAIEIKSNAISTGHIVDGTIKALDIDSSQVQQRVSATCAVGSSIRIIAQDGSVTCETDDDASNAWKLSGNTGTSAGTNFIGTTDAISFMIKAGNVQAGLFDIGGNFIVGDTTNAVSGTAGATNSSILGGLNNKIKSSNTGRHVLNSVIAGGKDNTIETTNSASEPTENAVISGGIFNNTNTSNGVIGGGFSNSVTAEMGTVPGGENNTVSGRNGFAAGYLGTVLHEGGFVWSDRSNIGNGVTTTNPNQFLIRAAGGVGINTNTPSSPLHVKGQGTSVGSTPGSNEVVLTIEPKVSTNNVATVINKLDTTKESALIFSTSNNPNFDLRMSQNSNTRDQLDFNHYELNGTKQTLMSLEYYDSPINSTIFMNADIFPDTGNTYDFGSPIKRWRGIYTENITSSTAVNVDSDRRLKEDIKQINYGLVDILAMRPVSYYLKADKEQKVQLGLIAQEVEAIIPEIVNKTDDEIQMRSMSYTELVPVLIKATQEQQALIERLNNKITKLESMLEKLIQSNIK